MQRISSGSTFYVKRVFPAIWFGIVGVVFFAVVGNGIAQRNVPLPAIVIPILMAVFSYLVMRQFVFDLADEVWDCGDSLLVKNKGVERRFDLSEFMNVSYTGFSNPQRIVLSLREASGDFGTQIAFVPPNRMFAYSTHPVASDLMKRIDESRRIS